MDVAFKYSTRNKSWIRHFQNSLNFILPSHIIGKEITDIFLSKKRLKAHAMHLKAIFLFLINTGGYCLCWQNQHLTLNGDVHPYFNPNTIFILHDFENDMALHRPPGRGTFWVFALLWNNNELSIRPTLELICHSDMLEEIYWKCWWQEHEMDLLRYKISKRRYI